MGAVGDGETDDTAAIQRALDAAEEAGGGVLRLPPGEYYTTYSLLYGSHTVLTGPGATLRFEPSDADGTALVSRSFDGSTETRDVVIEELAVESVDPEKGNGIGVAKAQNVTIRGCRTEELHWHLIDVAGAKDVSVRDCYAAGLGTAAYQADNLTEEGGLVVEHPDGSTETRSPTVPKTRTSTSRATSPRTAAAGSTCTGAGATTSRSRRTSSAGVPVLASWATPTPTGTTSSSRTISSRETASRAASISKVTIPTSRSRPTPSGTTSVGSPSLQDEAAAGGRTWPPTARATTRAVTLQAVAIRTAIPIPTSGRPSPRA